MSGELGTDIPARIRRAYLRVTAPSDSRLVWTTKDGRRVRICDMGDKHLENLIALIERKQAECAELGRTLLKKFVDALPILYRERGRRAACPR